MNFDLDFPGIDSDFDEFNSRPPKMSGEPSNHSSPAVVIDTRFVSADKLDNLDVAEELLHQYKTGLALLNSVLNDAEVAANQKAQVFSSVNSILSRIVADKTKTMNADRMRALETTLVTTLLEFPEMKAAFLERYERAVQALA